MSLHVAVNPMKCQGYGLCLGIAPEAFDMPAGSAVAVVVAEQFGEADRAILTEAARSCPAQAITLTES